MTARIFVHPATGRDPKRLAILQAFTTMIAIPDGDRIRLVRRSPGKLHQRGARNDAGR